MSDDQKQQALKEKELGNQAYKQRQFEEALTHYDKAWELDNTNITFLTNKAGKEQSSLINYNAMDCSLCLSFLHFSCLI
jgi:hypothetical protein